MDGHLSGDTISNDTRFLSKRGGLAQAILDFCNSVESIIETYNRKGTLRSTEVTLVHGMGEVINTTTMAVNWNPDSFTKKEVEVARRYISKHRPLTNLGKFPDAFKMIVDVGLHDGLDDLNESIAQWRLYASL